jgi:hypothetical protein
MCNVPAPAQKANKYGICIIEYFWGSTSYILAAWSDWENTMSWKVAAPVAKQGDPIHAQVSLLSSLEMSGIYRKIQGGTAV